MVALLWAVGALPVLLGQRCAIATLTHHPCPGCGLTRAAHLLLHGEIHASIAMHPLLVPLLLSHAAVAVATIVATQVHGAPWDMWRERWGKAAIAISAITYVAMLLVWALRAMGMLGGPVAVT